MRIIARSFRHGSMESAPETLVFCSQHNGPRVRFLQRFSFSVGRNQQTDAELKTPGVFYEAPGTTSDLFYIVLF